MGSLTLKSRHRLLCGDSTDRSQVARLVDGEQIDVCFTSPPYVQQRDYTAESDVTDWDALMQGVFSAIPTGNDELQVFVNLGLVHKNCEWMPYWDGWVAWMRTQGFRRFGLYVWDQGPGMPGDWNGRLAPSFEFVFHFNRKSIRPLKARECVHAGSEHGGKGQRDKSGTVRERHAGTAPVQATAIHDSVIRVNRQGAAPNAGGHPAPFPVGLPSLFLESWPGNVYEPFAGSGTTLVAAEQNSRRAFCMEISPAYCDVIVTRWEDLTGGQAVLVRLSGATEHDG